MASSPRAASRFAIRVAVEAAAIGALVFAALHAIWREQYYATGVVLLALAGVVMLDLMRVARTADRLYADFVDALAAGALDPPSARVHHFPAVTDSLRRASDRLTGDRREQAQHIQALEAFFDTVTAILFAVREDGEVMLANRAARAFVGGETKRLADMAAIGPLIAARLMHLPFGAREILHLADNRRVLASVALFRGAQGIPLRFISLQGLSSELSAVETRAWQDLVRVLSHEMMNSLTPVVSMSESLQRLLHTPGVEPDQALLQEARSAVDIIARRSAGLMSFVDRYRRVAELPELQLEIIQLSDLLDDLDRLAAAYGEGRKLSYRSHVAPRDLTIRADPDLLQQALLNLVKNAIEAVAATVGPKVEVACRATDHHILIAVSDNGSGLPENEPDQIFMPFFTTKSGGSGIGLALARQIAVAHGGELTVQRLPQGAMFSFALPLANAK